MPSITLKDIPEDLHAQLKREGEANFRSMAQEVLAPHPTQPSIWTTVSARTR